jgi:cold shock CspA family protein
MAAAAPRLGRVVAFDAPRGIGLIRGDDGVEQAFHATRLSDGTRAVEVGAAVAFVVGPGARPGSWEAVEVVKTG